MENITAGNHSPTPEFHHERSTLVELLRYRALHQPNQLAYTFLIDGEQEEVHLTYMELDRQARSIAAALQSLRAGGERALLLYPAGLDYIAAFFGCLYAGVIAAPAYPPRLNRSLLRLKAIVSDSQAAVVMATAQIFHNLKRGIGEASELEHLPWLATDGGLVDDASQWREPEINSSSLAFLQYTSGSTSAPKGVMVSHGNLLHNELLIRLICNHTKETRYVSWLPLYHDLGLIGNIIQSLFVGARCILMSPAAFLQRPLRWLEAVSRYRATTSGGPNFAYDLCVRKSTPEQRATLDLSSWTIAFNGAEPVRHETIERFAAAFAPYGFRREAIFPVYGLAEGTLIVSGPTKDDGPVTGCFDGEALKHNRLVSVSPQHENARVIVSSGQAARDLKVMIVDPETLTRCEEDRVGEIWVSGPSVARGYWDRLEETDRTFNAKLADGGDETFMRTGDLGFMQNGELFVTGRHKDLIIIRGRNHYPQDIELTVEQSHAALRVGGGAAFSVEAEGEERLVVAQEVERVHRHGNLEEIIDALRQSVAEEHEVEVYAVALIMPGTIPKTSSGKIQRRACRARYIEGTLELVGGDQLSIKWRENLTLDVEPTDVPSINKLPTIDAIAIGAIENSLLSFLAAKRRCSATQIDINKSLLGYGIDSLTAIELAHHIEARFGVILPTVSLFEDASIAQIARQALDYLKRDELPPSIRVSRGGHRSERLPLSFAQQRLWFIDQLEPGNALYNIPGGVRLEGSLNFEALESAINEIVRRHEALRTRFEEENGEPVQVIDEWEPREFGLTDLTSSSSSEKEEEVGRIAREEAGTGFDLNRGPLLRVKVLKLEEERHVLLLTMHHIVSDGWSIGVLSREVGELYRAYSRGESSPLPELPIQYADFAVWQREWLQGEALERQLGYWRGQLAGMEALELPADHPRPAMAGYRGASVRHEFSKELTEELRALSQREGVTLFMTLLAAFQTLLARYSGQEEIVVGSPIANRTRAETEALIGFFVNTLVLRTRVEGELSFQELLGRVREVCLGAYANQDLPLEQVVELLQPERDLSRQPLFQVALVLQNAPKGKMRLGTSGLRVRALEIPVETSKFDLSLEMAEAEDRLGCDLIYNSDLFEASTVERLLGHLGMILRRIVTNPVEPISDIEYLTGGERRQILGEWNATEREYPAEPSIQALFERQAERCPESVAVVFGDGCLSYRELSRRANQLAHYLKGEGVGPETPVGLCIEKSLEMIVGLLGILKAGGVYVPMDPAYPDARLRVMVEEAEIRLMLTEERLAQRFESQPVNLMRLDRDWRSVSTGSLEGLPSRMGPDNAAYVIYTSGSTGRPKGVVVTHGSVLNLFNAIDEKLRISKNDVWTMFHSYSFDFSVWEIWGALIYGGRLVVVPPLVARTPEEFKDLVRKQGVTILSQTPSAFRHFIKANEEEGGVASSLRAVIFGGEALEFQSLSAWMGRYGDETPQLINMYGITETTVHTTYKRVTHEDLKGSSRSVIGRPLGNMRMYVYDEGGQPAPVGIPGELYVGGEGMARGYKGREELTAERFIPARYGRAGERLYKTGDLVRYLSDGNIEYLGRKDAQVKIRGYRIELGEIQAVLSEHRSVKQSVVIAREDERGDNRLLGYVVVEEATSTSELRRYLKERLPEYMLPEAIITLDEAPVTANGKIDRKKLPPPSGARQLLNKSIVNPRDHLELQLVNIWENVLYARHIKIWI